MWACRRELEWRREKMKHAVEITVRKTSRTLPSPADVIGPDDNPTLTDKGKSA